MDCANCGNELKAGAKFCGKCGAAVSKASTITDVEVDRLRKKIKNTGNSVFAIGWVTIILNITIYLWATLGSMSFQDSGLAFPSLTNTLIFILASVVFVILGRRITLLTDKKIGVYLRILLVLSTLLGIWIIVTGGRIGLLFILVMIYLIASNFTINKLLKLPKFTQHLNSGRNILGKKFWIAFTIISIMIVGAAAVLEMSEATQQSATNNSGENSKELVNNYFSSTAEWKPFNSPKGFNILFPQYPETESETTPIPNTKYKMENTFYFANSTDNNEQYAVSVSIPIGVPEGRQYTNFEGPLNGMVASNPSNELSWSKEGNYKGYKALDYIIRNVPESVVIRGKMTLVGNTLFNVMYSYGVDAYVESNWVKFINSFTLR